MNQSGKSCLILSFIVLFTVQCNGQRRNNDSDKTIKQVTDFIWKITPENQIYCFKPEVNFFDTTSDIIRIEVREVKNDQLIPVYVNVLLKTSDTSVSLGNFTLYPPDKPSVFKFRIPDAIINIYNDKLSEIREICFMYIAESELNFRKENFIELNVSLKNEN